MPSYHPPAAIGTSEQTPIRHERPILVIEADDRLGLALVDRLLADGHVAKLARSARHATVLAAHASPTLVVLGALDSTDDAIALLRTIRASGPRSPWHHDVPVIVLGHECQQSDLLRAFEAGADDFLHSPPTYPELCARLGAVLRRTAKPGLGQVLRVGSLTIDTAARTATLHGRPVSLRPMEYELLVQLAREPTRVFRADELLRTVWGYAEPGRTRTVDTHAGRLRRKLGANGERWVINVRGFGYRLL